jgi:superfamily II DNA or RNA helicase
VQLLHTGDVVRARGRTWHVLGVRTYDSCCLLTLAEIGRAGSAIVRCELLTPFDRVEIVRKPSDQLRRVGTARWRRAAQALVARSGIWGVLRATHRADIDILPHQLEPAVAVLRGAGCRLLLADEVGLGKTIQACVLIAELRARGLADRVMVLTPPGLRDQWRDELRERFHVEASIADFRAVRQRVAAIPPDVNPWTTWPVAIASVDYVKRPEVLRTVLHAGWDVVVVDEAHRVANDGDRRRATAALAARAAYAILLTATPHSGNPASFESLCNLGGLADRLVIFRRTRHALKDAAHPRRIHRLHVRSTAAERRMVARLDTFGEAVQAERGASGRDMWIALALLRKRAYSSAHALHLSVTRRLETLAGRSSDASQLLLPLDELGETSDDRLPDWSATLGLSDPAHERRLLRALADAAAAASTHESKIRAIRRLLHRIDEPAIIFTEYRDTLVWVARQLPESALQLHGGLSRSERVATVKAFTDGATRLLLATDAAAEGLNLHRRCRLVINLELPWNPMRLEQRIGRVDRIGQQRAVHVFHLIGADTDETGVLEQLRTRIARARMDIGAPDPLDGALDVAADTAIDSETVDVSQEVSRLHLAKLLAAADLDDSRPLIANARNATTRSRMRGRTLSMWECALTDRAERTAASHLVAVSGRLASAEMVAAASGHWEATAATTVRAFTDAALRRTDAIVADIENDKAFADQPGLFDRRVTIARAALNAAHEESLARQRERADVLRASGDVRAATPRLRLVLRP